MKSILAPLLEEKEYHEIERAVGEGPVAVSGCAEMQKCQLIAALSGMDDMSYEDSDNSSKQIGSHVSGRTGDTLIITYDEARAAELIEDMRLYDRDVVYYPPRDLIFFSADIHGNAITSERLGVIRRLTDGDPVTVVTTIDGGMDACLPLKSYRSHERNVSVGDILDLTEFREQLIEMGYEHADQVEGEGEFQIRGGIIDIFPETEETAFRIEMFDDEVESIRRIDVESQRSVETVNEMSITPATEIMLSEERALSGLHKITQEAEEQIRKFKKNGQGDAAERLRHHIDTFKNNFEMYHGMVNLESFIMYFSGAEPVSFFDYFADRNVRVFIDEPLRVAERAHAIEEEFRESMKMRLEQGYILSGQADILFSYEEVLPKIQRYPLVSLSTLESSNLTGPGGDMEAHSPEFPHERQELPSEEPLEAFFLECDEEANSDRARAKTVSFSIPPVQSTGSYCGDFARLTEDIRKYCRKKYRILIMSASGTRGRRLADQFVSEDIPAFYDSDMDREILPGEVMISKGFLRKGFQYTDRQFVALTESDIFGTRHRKKKKKRYDGASINSFNDLHVGDYVVHENHGLGRYEGIEKVEVDHIIKDYLKVAYADGGNLYIPATSLEVLQKYAAADATPPKLNRLGTKEWGKTKARVQRAVDEIAEELVELYAKRRESRGYSFDKDTVWQAEFEEMFPYEETEDQIHAIKDVKRDMESTRIMDRLVCGDVGFGKTEIAIRAAFKAVMDGRQVAMLVPTTILASQHYQTFSERMKSFGVNVELLCRLRTPAEVRRTIAGLKNGSVDVVIGTHKVLGKSVEFKNLGLLIIDEEQRFGVRHKEKLKTLKTTVDVLTLTATPIPRTLHMSLIGIRDMSVLTEPPEDRMPIQTFVMERSDAIAREAILREIKRGGQVYYIYNRVQGIEMMQASLSELVPEARVAYAHGQMDERDLEDTMYSFVQGEIDVLVSTTIVESGLDIPNVNTIIIEDSDRFGLSQIYQLRGRVGRSGRAAYAFLMYRREKLLQEVAEKRLAAIREFTDLGSGFRISMRDLELRGAGNILGTGQHGHMAAVGYDLYCKMLDAAIKRLRGTEIPQEEYETSVDIRVDAFIPMEYIKNEFQKLDVYKRIAEIETVAEADDIREELNDRFGEPPKSVENLLTISLLKHRANRIYITALDENNGRLRAAMYPQAKIDPMKIPGIIKEAGGKLLFEPERTVNRMGQTINNPPFFTCSIDSDVLAEADWLIGQIEQLSLQEDSADKTE
ncbi:MAG: transcription-repair coupling factor [Eubacterium sp.]|nr:transcription-repair coupling factor [Eubacterium sp.]